MAFKREEIDAPRISFVGEQRGGIEDDFKAILSAFFVKNEIRCRAYLARVEYDKPNEFNVALCVKLISGRRQKLQNGVSKLFHDRFRSDEHLDVMVISDEQEEELRTVAAPFFSS